MRARCLFHSEYHYHRFEKAEVSPLPKHWGEENFMWLRNLRFTLAQAWMGMSMGALARTHTHTHTHTLSHSHSHTDTHTLMNACTHTHTYSHWHAHTHIHTHTHTYTHTWTRAHILSHTHTHTHTHMRARAHIFQTCLLLRFWRRIYAFGTVCTLIRVNLSKLRFSGRVLLLFGWFCWVCCVFFFVITQKQFIIAP